MIQEENQLMLSVKNKQKDIDRFVCLRLLPNIFKEDVRQTNHFREWLRVPMNYPRIMELPLTLELLDLNYNHSILDISSPKLLSLYLAEIGFKKITISDIEDYFIKDFASYLKAFNLSAKLDIFDARNIPYKNNTFDKVFSISVLEHIPDLGDVEVVQEVFRVLKPGGCFVFTLPAYHTYLEEWLKEATFYWTSKKNQEGSTFYQRRYDYDSLQKRFKNLGFEIQDIVFIAEHPIQPPTQNDNGMLLHNTYYIENLWQLKIVKRLFLKQIPLLRYFVYRLLSKRYHYLTRNPSDNNIRQVAIKLFRAV